MVGRLFQDRSGGVKLLCLGLVFSLGIALAQTLARQQFVSVFTQPEIGFTCERGLLSDGRERTLCQHGTALLEMVGNPRRLDSASLLAQVVEDDSVVPLGLTHVLVFTGAAFPNWDLGEWMGNALGRAWERRNGSGLSKWFHN